ncbi:MAG: hypothetical protein CO034_00700 [Parcubacteria group bacterium CG_4_9_14_0_2_um_filter_35_11]|nr:MAG: hypothetical protein COS98_02525 [Parcubacteria group bacterium CG07_land_8_20_14_0_80_35_11]PJC47962.1 MAG: hypothetical protein CO034_00700 [Parcubacteria group bacterium CG_4_9_14_0_2_um_filter_35_11]
MEETPKKGKNTGMAIVAYFLFFVPLLTDAKNDPFVKYHVKQGLVLFIAGIIAGFVSWFPIIGWIIGILVFVDWIIGIVNAANGQEKPIPLIGQFAEKFNI